jgi:Glycosyl hydrolase family 99
MLDWLFGGLPFRNLDDDGDKNQGWVPSFWQYSMCGATTNIMMDTTCPAVVSSSSSLALAPPSLPRTTTLQDIENAIDWKEHLRTHTNAKMTSSSIISKQSQSTSPNSDHLSCCNDSFVDDCSVVSMRQEEEPHRSRCWVFASLCLCLLVAGFIGLGVGLAMENQKSTSAAAAPSSSEPNEDEDSSFGVVQQTIAPSMFGIESPAEEDGFPTGNIEETLAPTDPEVQGDLVHDENNTNADVEAFPPELYYEDNTDENNIYNYTAKSDYLVGVYYYPWHGSNFHNGDGYIRKELIPPQHPALGEYDDSRPDVIAQHMKWFRKANIGLLITSWWGPNRLEDSNTKDVIMKHDEIGNLKIALHYETTGRIDGSDMSTARNDIQYMCEHYFDHPNYYRINDRPVLVIYITRQLHYEGLLEEALLIMRSEASKCGHNLYLIGDQVFASAPNPDEPFVPFWYFDAVTNYDVYGSAGQPSPYADKALVDAYYAEQEKWRQLALRENCRFIPPVSPGYNDRAVRLSSNHPPLSRRLSATDEEGSLFWYQLTKALPLVDSEVDNMILVNSFNEWHEDTVCTKSIETMTEKATSSQPISRARVVCLFVCTKSKLNQPLEVYPQQNRRCIRVGSSIHPMANCTSTFFRERRREVRIICSIITTMEIDNVCFLYKAIFVCGFLLISAIWIALDEQSVTPTDSIAWSCQFVMYRHHPQVRLNIQPDYHLPLGKVRGNIIISFAKSKWWRYLQQRTGVSTIGT